MPTGEIEKVKIQIESIRHHDTDSGFSIIKGRSFHDNRLLTLTGPFPPIKEGEFFEVEGSWVEHKIYGKQFKASNAKYFLPETRDAIKKFILNILFKDIRGLGEKSADRVIKNFGLKSLEVIESTPDKLVELKGFSKKQVSEISAAWQEHHYHASNTIFLTELGLNSLQIRKVTAAYGQEVKKTLTKDPYQVGIEVKGIGFKTCDNIAMTLGIAPTSKERIRGAIIHLIHKSEDNGDCFLPNARLIYDLVDLLQIQIEIIVESLHEIIQCLNNEHYIITDQYLIGETLHSDHYSSSLYEAERNTAQKIANLLKGKFSGFDPGSKSIKARTNNWLNTLKEKGTSLSDEQESAVRQAVESKVFILTGGPGVGKTTTANTIIRLLEAMGRSIAIAAPTGRAAQRVSEVSGKPATTIHRLLEWNPAEAGFKKNSDQPIASDVVIIDEASMLDIRLANSLIDAIKPEAQLILIGDADQLPSVGPGNVLSDLLNCEKIAFKKLMKVFRQSNQSKIIQAAHNINNGEYPEFKNTPESDCQFLHAPSTSEALEIIKELVTNKLPNAGYDPINSIQILSPMNKGDLGCTNLNTIMQKLLHKNIKKQSNSKSDFLIDDKVIQTSNNYDLGVFNGDIGFVKYKDTSEGALSVEYSGRLVHYSKEQLKELKLAYCITIHKSQGSEFPVVIIPASTSHYVMLKRNLFYTALTRGKQLAIFVGTQRALNQAVQDNKSSERMTKLQFRINSEVEEINKKNGIF